MLSSPTPISTDQHSWQRELKGVFAFVGLIWGVFLLEFVLPDLTKYGLTPRTTRGLVGIPAMPFLHANWQHIVSNTLPLVVLLLLLAGSHARSWLVVASIVLGGGALLWLFGRPATTHIGASGLVFGLIVFLMVSGLLERRFIPLAVALLVGFLYGGSVLGGVVPQFGSHVSWDGHLCGAIAGGVTAYLLASPRTTPRREESVPE